MSESGFRARSASSAIGETPRVWGDARGWLHAVRGMDSADPREIQILRLLAEGKSVDEVAVELGSDRTEIENHIANVVRKLELLDQIAQPVPVDGVAARASRQGMLNFFAPVRRLLDQMRATEPLEHARIPMALELALAAAIVVGALGVRLFGISELPTGMHGDEASVGLEAQRILREGSIGPYSPAALGMPAGPIYLTAVSVWLLGNTILAVRLVPALLSALMVLVLYAMLRRNFGPLTALLGSAIVASMSWSIHFARNGIPLGGWPLATVLASAVLMEAVRRRDDWRWWGLAGLAASIGFYVYQAHPVFLGGLGLFIGLYLLRRGRLPARGELVGAVVFTVALLAASRPMIVHILDPQSPYAGSFGYTSVLTKPEWLTLSTVQEQVAFLATRYVEFWDKLCCHPEANTIDGSGGFPLAPPSLLVLAALGAVQGLIRRRYALVVLGVLIVLLTPIASVLTVNGLARRGLAIAPFLGMFAAVAIVEAWGAIREQGGWWVRTAVVLPLAVVGLLVYTGVNDYFAKLPPSDPHRFTFARELTDAALFMRTLPEDRYVYFASQRWSVDYEPRRFLAPNVAAEDRSSEFGRLSFVVDYSKGTPVFVLLGGYRARLMDVEQRYPGGTVTYGSHLGGAGDNFSFVAYAAPPEVGLPQ